MSVRITIPSPLQHIHPTLAFWRNKLTFCRIAHIFWLICSLCSLPSRLSNQFYWQIRFSYIFLLRRITAHFMLHMIRKPISVSNPYLSHVIMAFLLVIGGRDPCSIHLILGGLLWLQPRVWWQWLWVQLVKVVQYHSAVWCTCLAAFSHSNHLVMTSLGSGHHCVEIQARVFGKIIDRSLEPSRRELSSQLQVSVLAISLLQATV